MHSFFSIRLRHKSGRNQVFDDDCGIWCSKGAHSCSYPYITDSRGNLKRIFWVVSTSKYCYERKCSGKRVYEPIEPQPAPAEITTVKRYYSVLQASNEYKRRCTWLVTEESTGPVAVIKYLGTHVKGGAHGNSKKAETKDQYIRTPASTMDTISELTKEMPVKAAYNKLLHKLDVNDAPRDINVVEKKKYRMTQRHRGRDACHNIADEWQCLQQQMIDNEWLHSFYRYNLKKSFKIYCIRYYFLLLAANTKIWFISAKLYWHVN